jgi:hypothetical protein
MSLELTVAETHNFPRTLPPSVEEHAEFHFPDEWRFIFLSLWEKFKCPCFGEPVLERKWVEGKLQYRVFCRDSEENTTGIALALRYPSNHQESTPWMPSSKDAIAHWKVVRALTR